MTTSTMRSTISLGPQLPTFSLGTCVISPYVKRSPSALLVWCCCHIVFPSSFPPLRHWLDSVNTHQTTAQLSGDEPRRRQVKEATVMSSYPTTAFPHSDEAQHANQ